jgi:hypothetical protein
MSGAAYYCELRPYPTSASGSFEICSRARVLGWHKDAEGNTLPTLATGRVALRAFLPSPRAPEGGMAFVETRCPRTGERRWHSPLKPDREYSDAEMRGVMRKLREAAAIT